MKCFTGHPLCSMKSHTQNLAITLPKVELDASDQNMRDFFQIIGRKSELFKDDITKFRTILENVVSASRFLVIGGAGSIGQAVVIEIFKRAPQKLHVVDINENNLAELVRHLRSTLGYIPGEFKTFALDVGSDIFDSFMNFDGQYDYILNLSALKHVRSEKDPFTLMRLIDVNIFNTDKTLKQAADKGVKKYFCVSTDKATKPVNMMGASKKIMEMFLMRRSLDIKVSTARFANVAFSDGSLLYSFQQRLQKRQPIVAPSDIKRYFITLKEAGELCLLSALLGENRDIFFPKLVSCLKLTSFADIAVRFLEDAGYTPHICETEEEARSMAGTLPQQGKWPCLFTTSDTTGEKNFEEFYQDDEILEMDRFKSIGIIKNDPIFDETLLNHFIETIHYYRQKGLWTRKQLIELFQEMIPDFHHKETGKFLDEKM